MSASKWEVSDNEARMGEFDDLCDDSLGTVKLKDLEKLHHKLFQPSWMAQLRKLRAD